MGKYLPSDHCAIQIKTKGYALHVLFLRLLNQSAMDLLATKLEGQRIRATITHALGASVDSADDLLRPGALAQFWLLGNRLLLISLAGG